MEDEFYDRCYSAWRQGRNCDEVSEDRWDDYRARGYEPEEISVEMLLPSEPDPFIGEPEWEAK